MQVIDNFLNNVTMYRLVVYVLGILAALSVVFALFGHMSVRPTNMIISMVILFVSAYVTDRGFGRWFNVPTNMESWLITALILFLIVQPATTVMSGVVLALAAAVSSASKFLLAWNGRHIFNPAALAAAVLSLTGLGAVTWWIGSSAFWPFALLLGLLVVRKTRRTALFVTFMVVAIGLQVWLFVHSNQDLGVSMKHAWASSPLIFLATIMLTEPATMPPRKSLQIIFAALVAVLYVAAWRLGPIVIYPEVALLIGNVFAYMVSPKFRARLQLKEIQKISDSVYNYVFQPDRVFTYLPGQYMELTLAGVPYDNRGNRRTFTLASSPTEEKVHIGLKYHEPASTFKAAFSTLEPGDIVYASQLAGNFTLKGKVHKKLLFVAGGIGITPFRSMIKYLTDTDTKCDIVLLYAVSDPAEFAYAKEFKLAARIGVRTIPMVTRPGIAVPGTINTKISAASIAQLVPDYDERVFYISGPDVMVDATKEQLRSLGVGLQNIMTDHFSGY